MKTIIKKFFRNKLEKSYTYLDEKNKENFPNNSFNFDTNKYDEEKEDGIDSEAEENIENKDNIKIDLGNEDAINNLYEDDDIFEKEEYEYYSDNEKRKKNVSLYMTKEYPERVDAYLYLYEHSTFIKEKLIKKKYKEIVKNFKKSRVNERTKAGMYKLLDRYNAERAKKYKINILKHDDNKGKDEVASKATMLMKAFLERLKIFRIGNTEDLDINALQSSERLSQKFINKNKKSVEDLYYQINFNVEKFYPDLISFNIPKILKNYPNLKRRELYEIFIQYKTLIKVCIALNKTMKILNRGLDFNIFKNGVSQMRTESEELAQKIFETINERNNNFLTWDEFMKGMLTIKSKNISDKIDMFFKVNIIFFMKLLDYRYRWKW
jgi:hypothetical protein